MLSEHYGLVPRAAGESQNDAQLGTLFRLYIREIASRLFFVGIFRVIQHANKKDVMLYARAVMEFKRRCRYFGIPVPDDPYLLTG